MNFERDRENKKKIHKETKQFLQKFEKIEVCC